MDWLGLLPLGYHVVVVFLQRAWQEDGLGF